MSPRRSDRFSVLDLAEAFHLARAVGTLHELKVLEALAERPATADALARRFDLDGAVLQGLLEYVSLRTDIIRQERRTFAATRAYEPATRFLLDLYLGAFLPNAVRLGDVLRNARAGAALVDRKRHARTFEDAAGRRERPVAAVIRQLGVRNVLDLGCGAADLLVHMGNADPDFVGTGIEKNRESCRVARARVRAARLAGRIRVYQGDSRRLSAVLPATVRGEVDGIAACQIANEMFRTGAGGAVGWLCGIRKALPGRPVIVGDYYGRLGSGIRAERHTLLHDYAQLISGQGVPPSRLREWQAIYRDAGYRLLHVLEDRATTQFIHVLL